MGENTARKLATVQVIKDLIPIEGADKIVLAEFESIGWRCIVEKGQFNVGDKCIYCEIDSVLPETPVFEFLRKRCWVDNGVVKGFRIRSMKMKGVLSQGICFPMYIIPILNDDIPKIGFDLTDVIGIVKYENDATIIKVVTKPKKFWKRIIWEIKAILKKIFPREDRGSFPNFIPKTDEERIQNYPKAFTGYKGKEYYKTEKLDGSSATYAFSKGKFYVCSRNLTRNINPVFKLFKKGMFWTTKDSLEDAGIWEKIANKYNLSERLAKMGGNYAIQGEIIGEGIQKNKYELKGHDFYIFSVFNIDKQQYLNYDEMIHFIDQLNAQLYNHKYGDYDYDYDDYRDLINLIILKMVPVLDDKFILTENTTGDELVKDASGKSKLNPKTDREGVVYRLKENVGEYFKNKVSFKCISNEFLLKWGE